MRKNLFVLSLTVLFLFGLSACSSNPAAPSAQGISFNGKMATVVLEENPTTGYTWAITIENQAILSLANDSYQQNKTGANVVGAGGLHTYIFQAKGPGTAFINFNLGQQWNGGQKNAQTEKYQVIIAADGNITSAKEV